jgi:hypothetical protein
LFLSLVIEYLLSKPRGTEIGWEATPVIYTDYVNVLAKHKHCKENPEALSVAIKEAGLELNVKKPKLMFMFLKSMQDKITT